MKELSFVFMLMLPWMATSQIIQRAMGELADSLVTRITEDSQVFLSGKPYEVVDSSYSAIIYADITALKKLPNKRIPIYPMEGIPTVTRLNVLYSTDKVNYTNYVLDTLDRNSGCCPCHLPGSVDYFYLANSKKKDELLVMKVMPVKHDCSSITSYWAILYGEVNHALETQQFNWKPIGMKSFFPIKEANEEQLIRKIRKLTK